MSTFKDSKAFSFQKAIRADIRKSDMTRGEKDVTLAIVNLWFYHKSGPKGFIAPGRAALAKKASVTERTVSRALAMLRAAGVLEATSNLNGEGQKRTRYKVRMLPLMLLCGSDIPEWIEGDLKPYIGAKMSRHSDEKCPATGGTKCPTIIRDVQGDQASGDSDLGCDHA
jgi:DNA-binding transcriptional ArsR family regulator